jgi:hypothetical protein
MHHRLTCNLHTLTHGAEPFLRRRQLCSYSRTSLHFMEPEGSFPYSQEPSTCPYPKPDRSSPYHHILSLQDPFEYCSPIYVLVFIVALSFLFSHQYPLCIPLLPHWCYMTCSVLGGPESLSIFVSSP